MVAGPFDLRPFNSGKFLASRQLDSQWSGTVPSHSGFVVKEPANLPASTDIFINDLSISCIDGTMADMDARMSATNPGSDSGMQFRDPLYSLTTSSSMAMTNPSDDINSNLSGDVTVYTTAFTASSSPKTETSTMQKRGRPRRARPASTTAGHFQRRPHHMVQAPDQHQERSRGFWRG